MRLIAVNVGLLGGMQKVKLYRRVFGLVLILVALATAWVMQLRYADRLLWGYRPLLLYLSLYGGILLFFFRWTKEKTSKSATSIESSNGGNRPIADPKLTNNQHLGLATLSGLLLGVGFPGWVPFPFLLLVALVPLLKLRDDLDGVENSGRKVFFYGFHAFLLYNIVATYWVTNTAFGPGIFAVVANTLLMCIPWMLFHLVSRTLPKVAYLSLPAFWLTFEWGHHNWELNWPWLTLGNGFAEFPALVQWYEYTGAMGGSLWILLVNVLLYRWWRDRGIAGTTDKSGPWWWLAVALLPIGLSLWRFSTYAPPPGETITVAAIQPNFEPHFEKFTAPERSQLDTFTRLSSAAVAAAGPVDYLLYPETSFSNIEEGTPLENAGLERLFSEIRTLNAQYLVTGWDGYNLFAPGEERTRAARRYVRNDGSILEFEAINGAIQINLADGTTQTYRKGVFVPGAESFPFRDVLFFMQPLVDALGGSVEGRGTQDTRTPLVAPDAKVAPVICYESVFGEYFTDYVKEGAQAIFVMTNDGWWDNTAGHRQHLYLSSLRAIETRRDVVRSANMGACAFIDQRGVIKERTHYDEIGFLNGEMQLNDHLTFYVNRGDYLSRIAGLLSIMLLLSTLTRRIKK